MTVIDRGRNSGVFGALVDFRGTDTPSFTVDVRAFQQSLTTQTKGRNGRGAGRWTKTRAFRPGGSLVLNGIVPMEGFPIPSEWRDQEGTLTLQYHKTTARTAKQTLSIRVTQAAISLDRESQNQWRIALTCEILASPSLSGWSGTQATATEATPSTQHLYDLSSRTHDTKNLQDAATVTYEVWPMGDSDDAERQAIANLIASVTAPPFPGAKVKTAQLLPGRDADAGTVTITFAHTDTEEDVVNPETQATVDPNLLESAATAVGIFSSPVSPGGNFVEQTTTTQEIHDTATKTTKAYGLLDTKEKIEFPGTSTKDDPYDLEDDGAITRVHDTSTPPADPTAPVGELVERETVQLNRYRWKTTWQYANLNSEQKIEFPAAVKEEDPSALKSTDTQADVTDSSTPPADPAPRISGLVLRVRRSRRVGGTPEKWLHTWDFGDRTTEQDVTFPGTVKDNEVSDIADEATVTLVNSSSTPPGTPAAPVGQLLSIESEQLTDAGKWRHSFKYGNTTALQKIQFPTDTIETDPSSLQDEDSQSDVAATSTIPATPATRVSGLVLRRTSSVRIAGTPEKWLHRWFFGRRTTAEDITFPGTVTTDEVSDIADEATVTLITASSSPPSTPSAPLGQLLDIQSEQLTDAGKWKHTFRFGNTTALQKIQFPTDVIEFDPSALEDEDHQSDTTGTSTIPATPATRVSGLVLRRTHSQRIAGTPEKWLHQWTFGRRTTAEDITFPGTVTSDEVSDLQDKATITLVTASGTPPSAPSAPVGQLIRTTSEQLTDAGKWKHVFDYGNTTAAQDVTFPESPIEDDPSDIDDEYAECQITSSSTAPGTPTPTPSTLKLRRRISTRIGGTPEQWKHVFRFARRNREDDVEMDGTEYHTDPSALEDKIDLTVVEADGTPDGIAAPSGYILRDTVKKQLHDSKWAITYRHARTTSQEDIEYAGSVPVVDANALLSEATVTLVTSSGTYPVSLNTPPTGLVLRTVRSQRLTDAGKWKHAGDYGLRDSVDDVEMPGSETTLDVNAIDSHQRETVVYTTTSGIPVPPAEASSELQRVALTTQELNRLKSKVVFEYDVLDSEQKRTFPKTSTDDDANNIEDAAVRAQIYDNSSGAPSLPGDTPTNNVKLIGKTDIPVTPDKSMRVWVYGPKDSGDTLVLPNYETNDDGSVLESTAVRAALDGTAISTPAGYTLRFTKTQPVTIGLGTNRTLTVKVYGLRTTQQDIEFLKSESTAETGALKERSVVVRVQGSSTPDSTGLNPDPTNLSLYWSQSHQLTSSKWEHAFDFRPLTAVEEDTAEYERDTIDPAFLKDDRFRVLYGATSTPSAAPAVSGLVHYKTDVRRVGKVKYRYVYEYRYQNTADELAASKDETLTDPGGLDDFAVSGVVFTGLPPADPTVSGLKLFSKVDYPTDNPAYTLRIYRFEKTTSDERIENQNTYTDEDPAALRTTQRIASFGSPSVDAALVLRSTRTQEYNDGKTLTIVEGGTRSTIQDITFDESRDRVDASSIKDVLVVTTVDGSASPPSTTVTGYQLREKATQQLTDASAGGEYKHTLTYGRATTKQEIEYDATEKTTSDDVLGDRWTITQVQTTDVAAAPGATLNGKALVLRETRSKQLATADGSYTGRWEYTYQYARNTLKDEIERPGTFRIWSPWQDIIKSDVTVQNDPADVRTLDTRITDARTLYKGDITVDEVRIRQIDNVSFETSIKRITEYADVNVIDVHAYREPRNTFLGAYFGEGGVVIKEVVAVYVSQVIAMGTGLYMVLCTPQVVWGYRARVSVKKKRVASALPFYGSYLNTCNASPWRGFPRRFVTFEGAESQAFGTASMAFPHGIIEQQKFLLDTQSFGDEAGVIVGTPFPWIANPGIGFKDVAFFGWAAKLMATADYDAGFPANDPA